MTKQNRRSWIKSCATLGAGVWLGTKTPALRAVSPNEKMNLAFVGVGGRGKDNLNGLKKHNLVAFCDVDGRRAKTAFEEFPKVKKYVDFRKMLDEVENKIDGVVISTPDHTHFHPAYQALQMGKHIFLEKPMAHNLWEIRKLCDLAREKKVATQLGVQRHTLKNMHRVVELIQAGAIGTVNEVYCWIDSDRGLTGRPKNRPAVPGHLNFDLWCGPAAKSDYHPTITPYGWRFWWNYGTGETGNWACHVLDIPFWALGLKQPSNVSGAGPNPDRSMTPKSMQSTFVFKETKSHGKLKLHWDQAKGGPAILKKHKLPAKGNNTLFIGNDGMLLCGFGQHKLYPTEKFADFKRPPQTIQASPGFYQEWVDACNGGEPATCNFEYSGPLAETAILANVAYRAQASFEWNAENLSTNNRAANSFLKERYRKGWQIS